MRLQWASYNSAMTIIRDITASFAILRQPLALWLLLLSLLCSVAIFAASCGAVWWLISQTDFLGSELAQRWHLDQVAGGAGLLVVSVLFYFSFPAIITALVSLTLEPVLGRLEQAHSHDLAPLRDSSIMEQLRVALRQLRRTLFITILLMPFYFIPGIGWLVALLVNAPLLARDYYYLIALRHIDLPTAEAHYKQHKWALWGRGLNIAALFLIPFINLLAPLLALQLMLQTILRLRLAKAPANVLPQSHPEGIEDQTIRL